MIEMAAPLDHRGSTNKVITHQAHRKMVSYAQLAQERAPEEKKEAHKGRTE
jgi:hypothetical protein